MGQKASGPKFLRFGPVRNQRNVVFQYLHTSSNNFTPQNCAILYQGMISSNQYSLFRLLSFHPKQVRLSHSNTFVLNIFSVTVILISGGWGYFIIIILIYFTIYICMF